METIKIGTIVKPHGVRGELKVYSSSDFIMDRLKKNAVVILEKNGKKTEMKVTASRMQQDMALVKFEGIDSMNDAELWRDADVLVDRKKIPALKEGYYFFIQFDADATVPAEVEKRVRIMDNVIRFLCVRRDAE